MKIAVTYNEGKIYEHFGETKMFYIYEDGKVSYLSAGDASHRELVDVLAKANVDVLICSGIGTGAVMFLGQAGIKVCVTGETDPLKACEDYVNGKLVYSSQATHICGHHHDN